MILSNDGLVAFHYRSYGTFFLHKIGSIISIGDLPTTNIIEPNFLWVLPFVVIYEGFYLIERLFVLAMHKKRLGQRSLKSEKRIISDIQKP